MSDTNEQAEKILATKESRAEAERDVMYPETSTKKIQFLSCEIELRALPIAVARKISKSLAPFKKQASNVADKASKGKTEDIQFDYDMDDTALEALLDVTAILMKFYGEGVPSSYTWDEETKTEDRNLKTYLENTANTGDLIRLAEAQLNVSGQADFLLSSLRIIISLVRSVAKSMADLPKELNS